MEACSRPPNSHAARPPVVYLSNDHSSPAPNAWHHFPQQTGSLREKRMHCAHRALHRTCDFTSASGNPVYFQGRRDAVAHTVHIQHRRRQLSSPAHHWDCGGSVYMRCGGGGGGSPSGCMCHLGCPPPMAMHIPGPRLGPRKKDQQITWAHNVPLSRRLCVGGWVLLSHCPPPPLATANTGRSTGRVAYQKPGRDAVNLLENNGWNCLWRGHPAQPTDHPKPPRP